MHFSVLQYKILLLCYCYASMEKNVFIQLNWFGECSLIRVGGGCATYSNQTYSKQVQFLIKATAILNLSAINLLLAEFLHVLGLVTISGTSEPLPFDKLTALSLSYF